MVSYVESEHRLGAHFFVLEKQVPALAQTVEEQNLALTEVDQILVQILGEALRIKTPCERVERALVLRGGVLAGLVTFLRVGVRQGDEIGHVTLVAVQHMRLGDEGKRSGLHASALTHECRPDPPRGPRRPAPPRRRTRASYRARPRDW